LLILVIYLAYMYTNYNISDRLNHINIVTRLQFLFLPLLVDHFKNIPMIG